MSVDNEVRSYRKGQVIESIKSDKEVNSVEKRLFKYILQRSVVRIRTYNQDNRLIKTSGKAYNPRGGCLRRSVQNKPTKVRAVHSFQ